jgi:hypothetical protein
MTKLSSDAIAVSLHATAVLQLRQQIGIALGTEGQLYDRGDVGSIQPAIGIAYKGALS